MIDASILERLADTLEARKGADPTSSYVAGLYHKGTDAVLKKVGEEATETVLAAKGGDKLALVRETADLWFHTLVMLAQAGLRPSDVLAELARREGISGLDEKAARNVSTPFRPSPSSKDGAERTSPVCSQGEGKK